MKKLSIILVIIIFIVGLYFIISKVQENISENEKYIQENIIQKNEEKNTTEYNTTNS